MPKKKYLIIVAGPTASGKTSFGIHLAQQYGVPIISADSRQFYKEMSIGTAKPTPEELAQAKHYFINSLSIEERYSVGDFEKDTLLLLAKLYKQHDIVLLVGGSGLFIKALCEGLDEYPDIPPTIKEEVELLYQTQGLEALQKKVQAIDPLFYEKVDINNPRRLMRALSVYKASGQPFSSFQNKEKKERFFVPLYLHLQLDRSILYNRINQRVDLMMQAGQLEEAKALYPKRHLNALQTVGYQELFQYFDGNCTLEEAVAMIKQNSRRYAKRQTTWFKRDKHWFHFHPTEKEVAKQLIDFIIVNEIHFNTTKTERGLLFSLKGNKHFATVILEEHHLFYLLKNIETNNSTLIQFLFHELQKQTNNRLSYYVATKEQLAYFDKRHFQQIDTEMLMPKIKSFFQNLLSKSDVLFIKKEN